MKKIKIPPIILIIIGFALLILIGGILLFLPVSHADEGLNFVDALFVSASAVCVTGLTPVVNLSAALSTFGKVVTACLMQIGGLGIVTVAIFVLTMIGAKIGTVQRYLVKDALNQNTASGMIRLVRDIIIITFAIEMVGVILNLFVFIPVFDDWKEAVGVSFFHAISSFNNCGLDIAGFGNSFENANFSANFIFNLNTSIMIILGGLGFIVIRDILANKRWSKFSIHTKIVLKMTGFLILLGFIALMLTEIRNPEFKWYHALFQSIASRNAGFTTFSFAALNGMSTLIITILMFIGASPSSTGGGIKTTTFYTIMKSFISYARGKPTLTYGRIIKDETKQKAFLLVLFAITTIILGTIAIMAVEMGTSGYFVTYSEAGLTVGMTIFEVTSAFTTTGYMTGVTPHLHGVSKMVLIICMYIGRLGPLTILSIWNKKWNINKSDNSDVHFVEEKIIIG